MKVIVFDIGGTLMEYKNMPLSWLDFYKDGFRYVCSELSLNITEDDIAKSFEVLKSYNPRINPREVDVTPEVIFSEATAHWQGKFELSDVINKFYESMNLTAYIYPETLDFLDKLKAEGYIIVALTDVAIGMPDELHKSYFPELLPYFDMYVSSISCGYRKPNPKGLSDIAENFGVASSEMIMIGDEEKDIKTAKRFGCKSVLIARRDRNVDFGQDYMVTDLNGLWEFCCEQC
ncbi:MAG: HAD family hydrolase [Ruminiclostridium sp.]|nr:HAD family hydrolase [Ruminiclostridium sp.]